MGLISAFTIIRAVSVVHLTAAYFFLAAPKMIADHNVVFVLGESMRLSHIATMDKPSEASAFIAVILALLAVSDLTAASMREDIAIQYWLANVPVRLALLFGITGYVYLFKEGGLFGPISAATSSSIGEPLQNSMVFSFGFFEIAAWFWVFTSLKDERGQIAVRRAQQMKVEEDSL